MAFFVPEPLHDHKQPNCIGVLLINLGTPAAPTAAALRPYLEQFLGDRRVIELPRWLWWLVLHGFILRWRPRISAEKYARIWNDKGSPLLLHTRELARCLQGTLQERTGKQPVRVAWAMRYGQPDISSALSELKLAGCTRILAIPLYPQYAASSSATACDALFRILMRTRNQPELRIVRSFPEFPGYIDALASSVQEHWAQHGQPDLLIMSFHGIPRASLDQGDPYYCECQKTGRLLAEKLGLAPDQFRITFQSRFGRTEWLKPYTAATLNDLGKARTRRVDVICPGFVADCLETLEEIAYECKAEFLSAGGGEFHYIPCLNERDGWISGLADLTQKHLAGWLDPAWDPASDQLARELSHQRASTLGAPH